MNPIRYRGYYYDTETGFYYLQSRYYDPTTCRFINSDEYASTGQGIFGQNMFAYCANNPIFFKDSFGHSIETALDIASALYSAYNLIGNPSWENAGYLLWDVASAIIPVLPGSYLATGGKVLFKAGGKIDEFIDDEMAKAVEKVYHDMPAVLDNVLEWVRENWRE